MPGPHARLLFLAVTALAASVTPASAKSYSAERFDVTAELLTDRSLAVEERIVFRFDGGEYTYVFREIPLDRSDGVADVAAEMDGTPFAQGEGPGLVDVDEGSSVRVTWRFAPTSGTHVFALRYRLLGVAVRDGTTDALAWHALPQAHRYAIDDVAVELTLAAGTRLTARPAVTPASAAVSIDDHADGTVRRADRVRVTARSLGSNASLRLDLRMAGGTLVGLPPVWQRVRDERARRGPWLLAAAAAILLIGFAWLAAFVSAWRRPGDDAQRSGPPPTGPPDPTLPVAMASALAAGRVRTLPAAAATMIDLAARRIVAIEEIPRQTPLGRRRFLVRRSGVTAALRSHETAWLAIAFGSATPSSHEAAFDQVQRRLRRRNVFARALQEDLLREGLVDPDRVTARRLLTRAALITAILGAAAVGLAVLLAPTFGGWAAAVPGAFAVIAAAYAVAVARFPVLSAGGARLGREWKAYFAELRRAAARKQGAAPPIAAERLPYAVAAGVGAEWVRASAAMPGSTALPAWFRAAAQGSDESGAAFVAFIGAHAGDAGASTGGSAGGGAAGGGASGAG